MHRTSRQELQNIHKGEDGVRLLPLAHQLKSYEHEVHFSSLGGRQKFKTSSRANGKKVLSRDETSFDGAVPTFVGGYREKAIPLSRSEKDRLIREESIRRREARIKQVREQEKLYAIRMIRRRYQKSKNMKSEAVSQKRKAWEVKQKTRLKDLGLQFKTSIINIGNAQHSAAMSIGEQADEARVILKTWGKAEQAEDMRYKMALLNQGRQMTKARRMKMEIDQRQSTRKCEQQSQRFNAAQFQAALNKAKNKRDRDGFVNTEKGESTPVKTVVSHVPLHGAGITDFCKTHFHHAVICHRGDKTRSDDAVMSNRGSHQYSQRATGDGGISGTDAALDERRLHVDRLSQREVDKVHWRERARHRCRLASEKIQMKAEFSAIEKKLKAMYSTSRTEQASLYPDELSDDLRKANGAEDSFVRNFIDADLSCDLNDSNLVMNETSALLFNIKSCRPGDVGKESMQTNIHLHEISGASDSEGSIKESMVEMPDVSHGLVDHDIDSNTQHNTQGEIIRISEGLSDLATELSSASEPKLIEHPQHEHEPFYESYLKKYSMGIIPSSTLDSAKSLGRSDHFVNDARTESSIIAGTVAAAAFAHDKNVECDIDVTVAMGQ